MLHLPVAATALLFGIPLKYLSLLILVVQNSALILVMRYTRASVPEDQRYLASTAVIMSEVTKTLACLAVLYNIPRRRSMARLGSFLHREMVVKWRECSKLAFPAILYLIQVCCSVSEDQVGIESIIVPRNKLTCISC